MNRLVSLARVRSARWLIVLVFTFAVPFLLPGNLFSLHAQSEEITLTVVVNVLNVRAGPGTGFARIGSVRAGDELVVIGKSGACAWLNVRLPNATTGWVSGAARFVTLNGRCADVPAATVANATPAAVSPTAAPTQPAQTPPTLTPTPPPSAPADELPPDQACILFQNYVGPELTVTMTSKNTHHVAEPKVPPGGSVVVCVPPDSYTVTIDAPPPWADLNAEVGLDAGDRLLWPVEGRP